MAAPATTTHGKLPVPLMHQNVPGDRKAGSASVYLASCVIIRGLYVSVQALHQKVHGVAEHQQVRMSTFWYMACTNTHVQSWKARE